MPLPLSTGVVGPGASWYRQTAPGAVAAAAVDCRWQWVAAAGISLDALRAAGLGPVNLETTVQFRQELRLGDLVTVTTSAAWDGGKTSRVTQELRRDDGTLCATVTSVSGLLDLDARRLVPRPRDRWRTMATRPDLLGL